MTIHPASFQARTTKKGVVLQSWWSRPICTLPHPSPQPRPSAAGGDCIKVGLPGKSVLGDYFQENKTSRRPFLLLMIDFPSRPIFIQFVPGGNGYSRDARSKSLCWRFWSCSLGRRRRTSSHQLIPAPRHRWSGDSPRGFWTSTPAGWQFNRIKKSPKEQSLSINRWGNVTCINCFKTNSASI